MATKNKQTHSKVRRYVKKESKENSYYFTISRFFQRRFLPLHFLHLTAVLALRAPQSLQIFMYRRCCCAMVFLTGSNIGMSRVPSV